jgi:CRISPR/Cas system-associated exonuclease Cas4 (RecB family)
MVRVETSTADPMQPAGSASTLSSANLVDQAALNPAQQQVLDELGTVDRPSFRPELRTELRQALEGELQPLLVETEEPVFVSKHDLSLLHGCEARFVAEQDQEFAWTVASARGTVAHKAIELLVTARDAPTPMDLVERAMSRIEADEKSLSLFIRGLNEAERSELAGRVNDLVATFTETFPPLSRRWVPVAESTVRARLAEGALTFGGKVDLTLGRARGVEAGKVLIDLKTGYPSVAHREDLRFYALLETMKLGVPPRLLVSYYLDAGTPHTEAVTEDVLWAAARRVVDGVAKLVDLTGPEPRTPTTTPGSNCRWCPLNESCEPGRRHLAGDDEDDWSPEG